MFIYLPILVAVILLLVALLFWFYRKNQDLRQRNQDLEKNPEMWRLQTAERIKERDTITSDIFSELEDEAQEVIKTQKEDLARFEQDYEPKVKEETDRFYKSLQATLANLNTQITSTQAQNTKFLGEQQKQITDWQEAVETETKNKINSFLESFETNMSQFFTKAEQTSLDSINLEIKSARSLIESYKNQQLSIVEENIVAVLERTLSLVLTQKLSLRDQMDMVYEALEKAKIEKFLV